MRQAEYWGDACRQLSRKDPVMKVLIRSYPDAILRSRGNAFETLLRAIVGQQISLKAADAVWARLCAVTPVRAEAVSQLAPDRLRSCGLSRMKAEYCRDLAGHFVEGRIRPRRWASMADEAIITELVEVRGIGRWTAEMFLIFHLLRPNVWPVDDLGLLRALSLHCAAKEKITPHRAREIGEAWQPWRTVATWYLWRSLDPMPVEY
jgi:DNA-3-methyladenine glycosylase II